jgi:hypothetical protein
MSQPQTPVVTNVSGHLLDTDDSELPFLLEVCCLAFLHLNSSSSSCLASLFLRHRFFAARFPLFFTTNTVKSGMRSCSSSLLDYSVSPP